MPYPHIKLGEQDLRKLIIVRSKVPLTMKPVSYTVTVVFLTKEVSAGKYEVIEIRHSQRSCKAGLLEKEQHVAALLFVYRRTSLGLDSGVNIYIEIMNV
jgi:hypothetical protein